MKKKGFVFLIFLFFWGCSQPFRVLIVGDFLSPNAKLHIEGREGVLWAIADLRQGKRINYNVVNIHNLAETDIERVVKRYHPSVIIGPFDSATALRVIPIANALHIPIIPPTVSSSLWSGKQDYMARLVPETTQEIQSILYVMRERGVRFPVLVWSEANEPYARTWIERFTNVFSRGVVFSYQPGKEMSFDEVVERVVKTFCDAVLLVAPGDEGGILVQKIRRRLPETSFFVSGWTMDKHFLRWSGQYGEGTVAVQHFVVSHTNRVYRQLYDRYVVQYREEPSFGFVYGYEAMMLAYQLYQKSGGNLQKRWFSLFPLTFEGLQSMVFLDKYGDATRPLSVMVVSNGKWVVYGDAYQQR